MKTYQLRCCTISSKRVYWICIDLKGPREISLFDIQFLDKITEKQAHLFYKWNPK